MKLFSKLFAFIPAAERAPWWAGLWYYDLERCGSRIAPWGLNFILGGLRALWFAIRRPSFTRWVRDRESEARDDLREFLAWKEHRRAAKRMFAETIIRPASRDYKQGEAVNEKF